MGLIIVTSTNKDVWDKNGYLESLGKPRITQVREADIAPSMQRKKTRIKRAEANMNMAASKNNRGKFKGHLPQYVDKVGSEINIPII
ncbi:hypothetical protein GCM10009597_14870 [Peribacillus frigoritolerans]